MRKQRTIFALAAAFVFYRYLCWSWFTANAEKLAIDGKGSDMAMRTSPLSGKAISCGAMNFAPRTPVESEAAHKSWVKAQNFVKKNGLSYLKPDAMRLHRDLLQAIEQKGVPGMIFECGVAKAGSSITFAAIKNKKRCLHLFDTFHGIPPPSDKDGKDVLGRYEIIKTGKVKTRNYYGYMENLKDFDYKQFVDAGIDPEEHSVFFHEGLFNETVWPTGPVAYAHLDGDWYESTYGMLERIEPYLSPGGYFLLDDVTHWSGARNAFQDFFGVNYKLLVNFTKPSVGCLTKRGSKRYAVFCGVRCGALLLAKDDASPNHRCP